MAPPGLRPPQPCGALRVLVAVFLTVQLLSESVGENIMG